MENAKQRILSWETRHGIRATGLRRRFNHALLEAAGKRKRQPETIDLTGDSDDDIAPTPPSRTIDLTSPSTTKRKTKKKKGSPKRKTNISEGSTSRTNPSTSVHVPERLTEDMFNDPNLLKRYQKTVGTEMLARRFLTEEENEAYASVDILNDLEEALDNDLYWTASQKLSKFKKRILDTTRVHDTHITCLKFGCTTKTDLLDGFCSKHSAQHQRNSDNDEQYFNSCISDLEAFKETFHQLPSRGSSRGTMVNEFIDDMTPLEKYLLQGRFSSCPPLGWDKSYLERTPQGTYHDRKDLLKQDYDKCMAKKGSKKYMLVPGTRQTGIRMPEERYRYVPPDGYDDKGVPRYSNGVQEALLHFVAEYYMKDYVSGSSFPIDPSTLKWDDDRTKLCVMRGKDTWEDGKGMKLAEPQCVARNALVEIWQTHRARTKTWREEKRKKKRGHNLFEFRRVRMGAEAIVRELSPFLFVGQSINGMVEGSYTVFFPHTFRWTMEP